MNHDDAFPPPSPATRLAHPDDPWTRQGFVNPPVVHASTVLHPSLDALLRDDVPYSYGRSGTPTSEALETALGQLDGAAGVRLAPSGLAAITMTLLSVLKAGDHLLVSDSVYGPTRRFSDQMLARFGIAVDYYDPCIGSGIAELLRDETRLVWAESPGSLTFEMQDLPALAAACRAREVLLAVDNTWATPLYCRPLALGADFSVVAATKYIVGHSDAMLGAVSAGPRGWAALQRGARLLGSCAAPDDVYLGLRGLRTLDVRLERHQRNGLEVARWLQQHPAIAEVRHPALPDDPGHALWRRDFSGASGLFAVRTRPCSQAALAACLDGLRYFGMGYSWGGFESLILPARLKGLRTATPMPANEGGWWLRLHVGLEQSGDLIADLDEGLKRLLSY